MTNPFTLRDYQVADLAGLIQNKRWGLFGDPGTGKTPPACLYFWYLWNELGEKTVWVMPRSLFAKNKEELLRFTEFTADEIAIVNGTPAQRQQMMADPRVKVFIMGYTGFGREWKFLKTNQPALNCMAADEIHMGYGGNDSFRTQELYKALRKIERFVPMTGTLVDGRLDTVYPTIHLMDPRYYYSHGSFMLEHLVTDIFGKAVGWRGHDKIQKILARHGVRHTFEEVYGPESKVQFTELCEMSPKQRAAYDEFEETALLELEDGWLDGTIAGVATVRCRQIMAHPETFKLLKPGELTGKDEALLVHIADHKNTGKPLVIFASLVPEQERLVELVREQGLSVELINGNVSPEKRALIDQAFKGGSIQVVVGSPATMAVGFNWEHVDHIIFVSLDYKDTNFLQAYRRAMRGVRATPLRITILEYVKSIDQRIFWILNRKSIDANLIDPSRQVIQLSTAA